MRKSFLSILSKRRIFFQSVVLFLTFHSARSLFLPFSLYMIFYLPLSLAYDFFTFLPPSLSSPFLSFLPISFIFLLSSRCSFLLLLPTHSAPFLPVFFLPLIFSPPPHIFFAACDSLCTLFVLSSFHPPTFSTFHSSIRNLLHFFHCIYSFDVI